MRKSLFPIFYVCLFSLLSVQVAFALPTVSDVTPFGFSVIWNVDGAANPEIVVFADPQGTMEVTPQLEIVAFPLSGGDPDGDENAWQLKKETLQSLASSLGMLKIQVHGCTPDTTYYFQVITNNGEGQVVSWPESSLAQVVTPWENSFVADGQQLLIELSGDAALDASGWLGTVSGSETMAPLSTYVGDGTETNHLLFNLSHFFTQDGTNWLPITDQDLVIEIRIPGGTVSRKTLSVPFTGNFAVARLHVLEMNQGGDIDTDDDGLPDDLEESSCTDPLLADSDDDGLTDGLEDNNHDGIIDTSETNPCAFDTDDDGLSDGEEVLHYGTNPLAVDSDDDGYDDYEEVSMGSSPLLSVSRPDYTFLPSDLDFDGDVDGIDALTFLGTYGKSKGEAGYLRRADINRDNIVDDFDFGFLAMDFGLQKGQSVYKSLLDFDHDGDIDGADLARFYVAYGTIIGDARFDKLIDLTGDGRIDIRDLAIFSAGFGT